MAKRVKGAICTKQIAEDGTKVSFRFGNGQEREFRVEEVPAKDMAYWVAFGLNHRLGDAYAAARHADEAVAMWERVADTIRTGQRRVAAGVDRHLIAAFVADAEAAGRDAADAMASLVTMTKDQLADEAKRLKVAVLRLKLAEAEAEAK